MAVTDLDIDIATYIEHTLLKPSAIPDEVKKVCQEAWQYNFPSVCIYPASVRQARELLHDKQPKVCTVIGFPTGAVTSAIKLQEALEAVENGATELRCRNQFGLGKNRRNRQNISRNCPNL